jgi:hypothetical protein
VNSLNWLIVAVFPGLLAHHAALPGASGGSAILPDRGAFDRGAHWAGANLARRETSKQEKNA